MPTPTPDQVVVNALLQHFGESEYPGEDPDEIFELFSATQTLKPKELSSEELAAGITDGDKDGGIDGFYVFLNGAVLSIDDPVLVPGGLAARMLGARPLLEVFLVQSKNSESWEEATWEHLLASLPALLDVGADDASLEALYRPSVVERTGIFRRAVIALAPMFPQVSFRALYVTRAPLRHVTPTVEDRRGKVERLIASLLTTGASVRAEHVGVERLYELAGTDYNRPAVLRFQSLIRETNSYLGVVRLADYLAFIRNEHGELREELFEANVRDFEGDNEVNDAIAETLAIPDDLDFWWLNNGVTVLGDDVDSPQQTLTISRPLVVNGLQTSHVLHRAEGDGLVASQRLENGLVVRVIVSTDDEVRDRIIAGTNRQTRVPSPALYATRPLQRDIERFLLVHGWFYERRKNRYKNVGKPAKRRITIGFLSQALITLMLGEPDTARARPTTLLSREDGYNRIFPDSLDRNAYLTAIEVVKSVDQFLQSEPAKSAMNEFTNARFYVAAGYLVLQLSLADTSDFHFEHNFRRLTQPLNTATLTKSLQVLARTADKYASDRPKASRDAIFKSADFRRMYFANLVAAS